MSRPEILQAPEDYYNDKESRKYNSSSRIINIQAEISARAIEMLSLPSNKPSYILDIGCGSGLSGQSLEEAGHFWVGCDISKSMLEVASERECTNGDLICHDMGIGLPFRPGSFDGAISISAIQWLCYSNSSDQIPQLRLNRFFSSLYSVLKRNARAVLQFYPDSPEQALLIAQSASKCGFAGGIVIDYPNSTRAKKYYLCLSFERTYKVPKAIGIDSSNDKVEIVLRDSKCEDQCIILFLRTEYLIFICRPHSTRAAASSSNIRDKDWIKRKKERMRKQGKEVKSDSKFSGRKRPRAF